MKPVLRILFLLLPVLFSTPADQAAGRSSSLSDFPALTVWAWQRPERLGFIDPSSVAVAYLDQTVYVHDQVAAEPRLQPLQVAPGTRVMAVVRIEMPSGADPESEEIKAAVAEAVLRSARRRGVAALQIDFDAVRSQRAFYAEVLRRVRRGMPAGMPLSMTALASWCAFDDWISGLPVDEAVPMLFRMGQEGRWFGRSGPAASFREPLCSGSLGLSTDEPWPDRIGTKRLYVFHPRSWTPDSLAILSKRVTR